MPLHIHQPEFNIYHRLPPTPTLSPNTTFEILRVFRMRLAVRAEGHSFFRYFRTLLLPVAAI